MNGRMYDPVIGKMLAPDMYVQSIYSTQSYNRYSYVTNNPLIFTDPSGYLADVGVTGYRLSTASYDFEYLVDELGEGRGAFMGNNSINTQSKVGHGGGSGGNGKPNPQVIKIKTKDGKMVTVTLKQPLTKEQLEKLEKLGLVIDATDNAYELTNNTIVALQKMVNSMSGTEYAILDLEKLGIQLGEIGSITLKGLSDAVPAVDIVISGANMINNGVNWENGTDMAMSGVAFIPVIGWGISGAYWIINLGVKGATGHEAGYYLGQGADYESPIWEQYPETSPLSHPIP